VLTRCPACAVWFRVRAEHLSVAAGYVTCGACDTVFNALASLVEEAPSPVWAGPVSPPAVSLPEPEPESQPPPSTTVAATPAAPSWSAHSASSEDSLQPALPSIDAMAAELQQPIPHGALAGADDGAHHALPERDHAQPWTSVTEPLTEERAANEQPSFPDGSVPPERESLSAPAAERLAGHEFEFAVELPREARVAPDQTDFTSARDEATPDAPGEPQPFGPFVALALRADEQPQPVDADTPTVSTDETMTPLSPDAGPVHEQESSTAVREAIRDAGAESEPAPSTDELPAHADEQHARSADDSRLEPDEEPIPELLRNEIIALERERRRTPRRGVLWALACTALVLVLVAQLSYVYRDRVIAYWPAAAPLVADLCAELGCPTNHEPIASPVELLARDVREHPQYHDALLVNATLVNSSASATPFPVLELVLHDATGGTIGARRFRPEEYLDHSIAIEAGMSPAQPVYIVIELGGSATAATSFEFSFM